MTPSSYDALGDLSRPSHRDHSGFPVTSHKNQLRKKANGRGGATTRKRGYVNCRPFALGGKNATISRVFSAFSPGVGLSSDASTRVASPRFRHDPVAARAGGPPRRELRGRDRRLEARTRRRGDPPARSRARRAWASSLVLGPRAHSHACAHAARARALPALWLVASVTRGSALPPVQRSEGGAR